MYPKVLMRSLIQANEIIKNRKEECQSQSLFVQEQTVQGLTV